MNIEMITAEITTIISLLVAVIIAVIVAVKKICNAIKNVNINTLNGYERQLKATKTVSDNNSLLIAKLDALTIEIATIKEVNAIQAQQIKEINHKLILVGGNQ